jgi:hypothetical protein
VATSNLRSPNITAHFRLKVDSPAQKVRKPIVCYLTSSSCQICWLTVLLLIYVLNFVR